MASEMAMPGQEPKKGMSKGCMVALIVVGVLVLMVIIAGSICYMKKDELMKAGIRMMVNPIQHELMDNPVEGVDTVVVNCVADAFLAKLETSEIEMERYGHFVQMVQGLMEDKVIDADEADQFVQGMIDYYPELEELLPEEAPEGMEEGTEEATDTLGTIDN